MGIHERRQREFEDRERMFLDCARELIREEGLLSLQVSRIADKSDYAVGTLYRHFLSKEDLLLALTAAGAQRQAELFQRVATWQAGSRERMLAIAVADMIFVRCDPEFFRLVQYVLTDVVWRAASPRRRAAFMNATAPIGRTVLQIVNDAVAAGDLDLAGLTPPEICTGLWALSLGTHNLVHAEGILEGFNVREPYRRMCRHMQVLMNGHGWLPLVDASDGPALDLLIERICQELFLDLCGEVAQRPRFGQAPVVP